MLQRSERRDAARHREIILNTATELFKVHGVDSVSMHQIAKSAGVGQGTLYRRYSSKADLCIDLLMESFRRFEEGMARQLGELADRPVRERMTAFLSGWIDFVSEKIHWLSAIRPATFCQEDLYKYYQAPPCVMLMDNIRRLSEEGAAKGEIGGVDANFLAFNMAAAFNPDAFLYLMNVCGLTPDQIKERYTKLYDGLVFRA